ncbi:nucleolar protein 4-like [Diadema antillarum]|uniref:nucleolar protein 4-like n=1 Tax=Diadema antillarum TaxID=105358 RepID=UPI003A8A716A
MNTASDTSNNGEQNPQIIGEKQSSGERLEGEGEIEGTIPPAQYCRWVEKTYGDSGKTKTVTRKKYNRIVAVLKGEELPSAENGRFRFWIKGKNFKLAPAERGQPDFEKEVLYVPVKSTESDGTIVDRGYKRVAVVEDFYTIIHSVHVGTDSKNGKHAGQKRTYRAVAESYAFLPREAVTRFLMSCSECQKRMHLTFDMCAEGGQAGRAPKPSTNGNTACDEAVKDIDYNLPITTTYLNHLRNMRITQNENGEDETSLSSADTEISDPSLLSETSASQAVEGVSTPAEPDRLSPLPLDLKKGERASGDHAHDEWNKQSNEVPPCIEEESTSPPVDSPTPQIVTTLKNGIAGTVYPDVPLHVFCATPESAPPLLEGSLRVEKKGEAVVAIGLSALTFIGRIGGPYLRNTKPDFQQTFFPCTSRDFLPFYPLFLYDLFRAYPGETMKESGNQGTHTPDEHGRSSAEPDTQAKTDGAPKSSIMRAPPDAPSPGQVFGASSNGYGYSLLAAATGESSRETPEDLTVKDEDDDDDGDDDSDKLPDNAPGVDPERLKAFNMFVRLFVDENLDRMVPISKQPKEKIQAIIEACYRQFPEFHERARKRIRTYLKSCRRMKRQRDQNGLDSVNTQIKHSTLPTPPHLTSARAEHILAAACESESENAKRLRMELMQAGHTSESVRVDTQQHTPTQPQTTPTPTPRTSYEEPPAKLAPRTIDYHFTNGVGTHDPYYASIAPHHTANVLQATQQHAQLTNGKALSPPRVVLYPS